MLPVFTLATGTLAPITRTHFRRFIASAKMGPCNRLARKPVFEKFLNLQHQTELVTQLRFSLPVLSMAVKQWNFARQKRVTTLL